MSHRRVLGSIAPAVLAVLLTGCLNDSGGAAGGGDSPPPPAPGPAAAPPQALRALEVQVTGPGGIPLAGAQVSVSVSHPSQSLTRTSDAEGRARFDAVTPTFGISVSHSFGYHHAGAAAIPGNAPYQARLEPHRQTTVALLPARVVDGSVSTDRRQLDLALTIVASAKLPLAPASYGASGATPYIALGNCWAWQDHAQDPPACRYPDPDGTTVVSYAYHPAGAPAWPGATGPFSATLLLDQAQRATGYDPHDLRWFAARHFRQQLTGGLSSITGFAGNSTSPMWAPLILPPPAWSEPPSPAAFAADPQLQQAALENLRMTGGGTSPVHEALARAAQLLAAHAPAGRKSLVAVLGGGDESAMTATQRQASLDQLRQQFTAAAVTTVLVTSRLAATSPVRQELAGIAAALEAPLVIAGKPADWLEGFADQDGLYQALGFAAEIVSGTPLPTLQVVFRLRRNAGAPFESGSMLHGTVNVESELCPMGCAELPLPFAARIP
jgi:hypothetical protein